MQDEAATLSDWAPISQSRSQGVSLGRSVQARSPIAESVALFSPPSSPKKFGIGLAKSKMVEIRGAPCFLAIARTPLFFDFDHTVENSSSKSLGAVTRPVTCTLR